MCVLSLIGRSRAGRAELQKHKWDTHNICDGYIGHDGVSYSVCLAHPQSHRPFITVWVPVLHQG